MFAPRRDKRFIFVRAAVTGVFITELREDVIARGGAGCRCSWRWRWKGGKAEEDADGVLTRPGRTARDNVRGKALPVECRAQRPRGCAATDRDAGQNLVPEQTEQMEATDECR